MTRPVTQKASESFGSTTVVSATAQLHLRTNKARKDAKENHGHEETRAAEDKEESAQVVSGVETSPASPRYYQTATAAGARHRFKKKSIYCLWN